MIEIGGLRESVEMGLVTHDVLKFFSMPDELVGQKPLSDVPGWQAERPPH